MVAGVDVTVNLAGGGNGIVWSQNGSCPGVPASSSALPGWFAGYQGAVRASNLNVVP